MCIGILSSAKIGFLFSLIGSNDLKMDSTFWQSKFWKSMKNCTSAKLFSKNKLCIFSSKLAILFLRIFSFPVFQRDSYL